MENRDGEDYQGLLDSILERYGYDFKDYAESSLQRRIRHYMDNKQITRLSDLEKMLAGREDIFEEFLQSMSVTVTEMFRDPLFFRKIREMIVPRLATYPFIKIWIAGCATGQEAYSIAIILKEENLSERAIIYATDINQKSLVIAKEGVYNMESMQLYTNNYQKAGGRYSFSDYYVAKYGSVLFNKSLKENIVFAPHNLANDQCFNEFQLIICRNVIMYFNQALQNKVVKLFHQSLCPFGFIGLGDKESLLFNESKHLFEELDRKEKIYMKVK